MSRFLPIVVMVLWLTAWPAGPWHLSATVGLTIFMGGYALAIAVVAIASRRMARNVYTPEAIARLRRLNIITFSARIFVAAWLAAGIYLLGWKSLVASCLEATPIRNIPIDSPGLILGILPAVGAWMAMIWAQFPADHAMWEHNVMIEVDENLAIHEAPSLWSYFNVNVRLKILFAAAPALVLFILRDAIQFGLSHVPWMMNHPQAMELLTSLPPFLLVLIFAPEIVRRILVTQSMPDTPLRRRLEEICARNKIGIRDVLLWHTRSQMGNAAVIGLVSRLRYVLMSDLLIETLSDQQIEAVFAHEIGHVRHRHLLWLTASIYGLVIALAGPGQWAANGISFLLNHLRMNETAQVATLTAIGFGILVLMFGYISRRFESQADVFAARTMQQEAPAENDPTNHVGQYGAHTVSSALHRVAAINNIPIASRSWSHGSIAQRMQFLTHMGGDPTSTRRFDQFMWKMYLVIFAGLIALSAWLAIALLTGKAAVADFL